MDEKVVKPHGYQYVENPTTLGELIRNKRIELGIFQKDIALQFGVSEDCITYWENNRSIPQIQFYPKIFKFLGYLPFKIDTSTEAGKLKMYRYLNGLSHKKMGQLIGVSGSTISDWENGNGIPKNGQYDQIFKSQKPSFHI